MKYDITRLEPTTFYRLFTNTDRTALSIYTVKNQKLTYTFETKDEFEEFAKALNNYSRKHCTGVVIYVDDSQI